MYVFLYDSPENDRNVGSFPQDVSHTVLPSFFSVPMFPETVDRVGIYTSKGSLLSPAEQEDVGRGTVRRKGRRPGEIGRNKGRMESRSGDLRHGEWTSIHSS